MAQRSVEGSKFAQSTSQQFVFFRVLEEQKPPLLGRPSSNEARGVLSCYSLVSRQFHHHSSLTHAPAGLFLSLRQTFFHCDVDGQEVFAGCRPGGQKKITGLKNCVPGSGSQSTKLCPAARQPDC